MSEQPLILSVNDMSPISLSFDVQSYIYVILSLQNISHGQFDFNFISNDEIISINKKHLNRDYPTDIISFNLGTIDNIVGDVYISVEQAQINAREYNQTLDTELKRLIIHGVLHLLDYRDYTDDEKTIMHREQERLLTEAESIWQSDLKNANH